MSEYDPDAINRLIGEFVDLQEVWEKNPQAFDWLRLQALAQKGAHAYNEGAGPSFHALAFDGVWHSEYHERFLAYALQAGFDPFKLAQAGTMTAAIPVIDHELLSEAAWSNPSAARMRALLMEVARARFEPIAQEIEQSKPGVLEQWFRVVEACAESIPLDLLERIAPELAREHHAQQGRVERVDPVEGYLCSAEVIVDSRSEPYG